MNDKSLREMGFCEWKAFGLGVEKLAPERKGVYAFQGPGHVALKRGSSDIMYIGRASADRKGPYHNLRHCLREYLHPGHDQKNKIRIGEKALAGRWYVAWVLADAPNCLEARLLRRFREEHDQLPPENRRMPKLCDHDR